jgi:pimeloyl-ACP methyl ester carboxylesterase
MFCCFFSFLLLLFLLNPQIVFAKNMENQVDNEKSCVVLLHGLARTSRSMEKIGSYLSDSGYFVENIDYPSRKFSIEVLAENVLPEALKRCTDHDPKQIHFVTHSLGGIILRYYLAQHDIEKLGRVVMLSPPNNGSEIVDNISDWPGFYFINGPAGKALGTDSSGVPAKLGPVAFEVGVITGNISFNPFYSYLIPGDDDGKVSVASARIQGMTDFLIVPHSHSFIMNSKKVMQETEKFLRYGYF